MNNRFLMVGTAVLALAAAGVAAIADTPPAGAPRAERHRMGDIDANKDGFLTRDEVRAQTERMFDHMDTNDDGKIDSNDRGRFERRIVEKHVDRKDGKAKWKGKDDVEKEIDELIIEHGGTPGDGERRVIVIEREERGGEGDRHVIVRRHGPGGEDGPGRGHGPRVHVMGGGMPFMMMMHSDEADTNRDGALSKQEMVTQHLRFFDAADANGDGKVKFDPPTPPTAPTPPAPPAPPR